jgi:hypothetical protein
LESLLPFRWVFAIVGVLAWAISCQKAPTVTLVDCHEAKIETKSAIVSWAIQGAEIEGLPQPGYNLWSCKKILLYIDCPKLNPTIPFGAPTVVFLKGLYLGPFPLPADTAYVEVFTHEVKSHSEYMSIRVYPGGKGDPEQTNVEILHEGGCYKAIVRGHFMVPRELYDVEAKP